MTAARLYVVYYICSQYAVALTWLREFQGYEFDMPIFLTQEETRVYPPPLPPHTRTDIHGRTIINNTVYAPRKILSGKMVRSRRPRLKKDRVEGKIYKKKKSKKLTLFTCIEYGKTVVCARARASIDGKIGIFPSDPFRSGGDVSNYSFDTARR